MHAELAVDLGEVPGDGLRAERQRVGHLVVALSGADEGDDALLGFREPGALRCAAADAAKLRAGLVGPQAGAEALEGIEGLFERLAGGALLTGLALDRAEREQGAGALEGLGYALVVGEGARDGGLGRGKVAGGG